MTSRPFVCGSKPLSMECSIWVKTCLLPSTSFSSENGTMVSRQEWGVGGGGRGEALKDAEAWVVERLDFLSLLFYHVDLYYCVSPLPQLFRGLLSYALNRDLL